MKISPSDVKKGKILKVNDKLYKVLDTSHTHTGRGSATYSFKVKDIVNGGNLTLTYKSSATLEEADVQTKNSVYLYSGQNSYTFMVNDTAEMFEVHENKIDDIVPYLKENLDCYLMIYEGNVIGVILPDTIDYVVKETVPGVKGDRSSAGKKPATLENDMEVQIPLHLEAGATVTVNTLTGNVG